MRLSQSLLLFALAISSSSHWQKVFGRQGRKLFYDCQKQHESERKIGNKQAPIKTQNHVSFCIGEVLSGIILHLGICYCFPDETNQKLLTLAIDGVLFKNKLIIFKCTRDMKVCDRLTYLRRYYILMNHKFILLCDLLRNIFLS